MSYPHFYRGDNYHHCVDCGSTINCGDMVFRGKWGYRCYTCQYYFDERETMTNIKITAEVDGKIIPLNTISAETFEAIKALEKPKAIPVARLAITSGGRGSRLLFKPAHKITFEQGRVYALEVKHGILPNCLT